MTGAYTIGMLAWCLVGAVGLFLLVVGTFRSMVLGPVHPWVDRGYFVFMTWLLLTVLGVMGWAVWHGRG